MTQTPTTQQLTTYLQQLYAARTALLTYKSTTVAGTTVTKADEKWISSEIARVERIINIRNGNGAGSSARVIFNRGGR